MYQAVYTLGNIFWLRYKLQGKFPSSTYPEMNMSRNFFGPAIVARSRSRFYFFVTILTTLQRIFPALCRGVTLNNVACNLSRNGSIKLPDKLQEKLPSVTAHLTCVQAFLFPCKGNRHALRDGAFLSLLRIRSAQKEFAHQYKGIFACLRLCEKSRS